MLPSPAVLLRMFVLVLAGAGGGALLHLVRHDDLRVTRYEAPTMCEGAEGEGATREIDPAAAAALCGRSDVLIADARSAERFAEGHIAGAVHLPCGAAGAVASHALHHLQGVRTILVYGQEADDAAAVAASLRRMHHPDVRVLRGGFSAWERAGQACASGPCDECRVANP